jgi:hypothetical protein
MKMLALHLIAALVVLGLGCDSGDEGGAGAGGAMASGGSSGSGSGGMSGAGGSGGSGGAGGMSGGASGASGASGGSGGFGGMSGGSGGMSGGASGGSGGMTGGSGGMTGGSGGMTGGSGGGEPYDMCNDALVRADACPACEDDEGCATPTYTVNGDGTVTSSCCGLVFQQACDRMMTYIFSDAVAYCEGLTLAGGGWRLPEKEELFTLLLHDQDPTLDAVAFPGEPLDMYWTATQVRNIPDEHWGIHFWVDSGGFASQERDEFPNFNVRCVR